MNRATKMLIAAGAVLMLNAAQAGVTFYGGCVAGVDVPALGKFYESAFGLREVNRIEIPGGPEIMMNFGDTVAAAKANTNAQIVIQHRESNAMKDATAHLIFNVTDMAATVAAVKAAGGTVDDGPRAVGNTGITIAFVVDPAGNRVELLQQPIR